MPQNSAYYTDLEIPTLNADGSTYGTIINVFLNNLLIKLKDVSDRVTAAQGQLTNINRGTNAVDRINNTLAGSIGSSALVSGSWTTLYPDPYSGSYTKTTTWPAYTSDLTSYSPPTTQSEVENFNYQGFANVLQAKLDLIEGRVDQAEADILNSQINCCRTKKYLDAIDATTFSQVLGLTQLSSTTSGMTVTSSTTLQISGGNSAVPTSDVDLYGEGYGPTSPLPQYEFSLGSQGNLRLGSNSLRYNSTVVGVFSAIWAPRTHRENLSGNNTKASIRYSGGNYIVTLGEGQTFTSSSGTLTGTFILYRKELQTVANTPTVDISSCNSPSPPYFI